LESGTIPVEMSLQSPVRGMLYFMSTFLLAKKKKKIFVIQICAQNLFSTVSFSLLLFRWLN